MIRIISFDKTIVYKMLCSLIISIFTYQNLNAYSRNILREISIIDSAYINNYPYYLENLDSIPDSLHDIVVHTKFYLDPQSNDITYQLHRDNKEFLERYKRNISYITIDKLKALFIYYDILYIEMQASAKTIIHEENQLIPLSDIERISDQILQPLWDKIKEIIKQIFPIE